MKIFKHTRNYEKIYLLTLLLLTTGLVLQAAPKADPAFIARMKAVKNARLQNPSTRDAAILSATRMLNMEAPKNEGLNQLIAKPNRTQKAKVQLAKKSNESPQLRSIQPFATTLPDSAVTTVDDIKKEKLLFSTGIVNGSVVTTYYEIDATTGEEVLIYRTTETYNADGNQTSIIYDYWEAEWITESKEITTYFKGEKISSFQLIGWDNTTKSWFNYQKSVFTYDSNERLSLIKFYVEGVLDWQYNGEAKVTSEDVSYIDNGTVITQFYYKYYGKGIADTDYATAPYYAEYLTYDAKNQEIIKDFYDNELGTFLSIERAFNGLNKIAAAYYGKYAPDFSSWAQTGVTQWYYYEEGDLGLIASGANLVNDAWLNISQTEYFYSEPGSGIETGETTVSANASIKNNVLTVNTDKAETITVVSIAGQTVYATAKTAGAFTTTIDLPQGLYIVKGSGWAEKVLVK